MKTEDLKWLKSFESNFRTAINSNYSRNVLESQLRKMVQIYEQETGKKYTLCYHCSTSVLYFLKDMGKLYFEKVQAGNEQELDINELDDKVTNTKNNTTKNTKRNAKHTTKQSK